jgi:PTH1 family peptidyl-tRNA hydrolase
LIKLVVGLGNPGSRYAKTRHNAGFWFLEELPVAEMTWRQEVRFQGVVAKSVINDQKVLFLLPETFMNRSGQSVANLARYFKIQPEEILVVHDELDFEPGEIRLKKDGGHAGHNGLKDIIAHLGAKNFCRLRVGIGRPPGRQKVVDYVLSEPSRSDKEKIMACFDSIYENFSQLIAADFDPFMQQLHSKKLS